MLTNHQHDPKHTVIRTFAQNTNNLCTLNKQPCLFSILSLINTVRDWKSVCVCSTFSPWNARPQLFTILSLKVGNSLTFDWLHFAERGNEFFIRIILLFFHSLAVPNGNHPTAIQLMQSAHTWLPEVFKVSISNTLGILQHDFNENYLRIVFVDKRVNKRIRLVFDLTIQLDSQSLWRYKLRQAINTGNTLFKVGWALNSSTPTCSLKRNDVEEL
jgi:hypothetical protein